MVRTATVELTRSPEIGNREQGDFAEHSLGDQEIIERLQAPIDTFKHVVLIREQAAVMVPAADIHHEDLTLLVKRCGCRLSNFDRPGNGQQVGSKVTCKRRRIPNGCVIESSVESDPRISSGYVFISHRTFKQIGVGLARQILLHRGVDAIDGVCSRWVAGIQLGT